MVKKLSKIIIFVVFLVVIFLIVINQKELSFSDHEATYLYDNEQLLTVTTDKTISSEINNIASDKKNLEITKSVGILEYNEEDVSIDEIKKQAAVELEHGYMYTIDGNHTVVVSSKDLMEEAYDNVLQLFISDSAFQTYLATGKIPQFTKNGKTYSEFYISSDFEVVEGNYPKNEIKSNVSDVQYFLLNGDVPPTYEYITSDVSYKDIIKENSLDENLVYLNNPEIGNETLNYVGQEVIVNEPSPVFEMVGYYEMSETRDIEYQKFEKPSDELYVGESEIDQEGENGAEELKYRNKEINGEIVEQTLLENRVVLEPKNEITLVGTKTYFSGSGSGSSGGNFSGDQGFEFVDGSGNFAWPAVCRTVTNGYYGYAGHDAVDIQCGYGSPVYAADAGTVVDAGYNAGGYGNFVKIDHGNGYQTLYGHMAQPPNVSAGATVYRGEVIGYEGNSGNSTGHHLHFEIRLNDSKPYLNPLNFY